MKRKEYTNQDQEADSTEIEKIQEAKKYQQLLGWKDNTIVKDGKVDEVLLERAKEKIHGYVDSEHMEELPMWPEDDRSLEYSRKFQNRMNDAMLEVAEDAARALAEYEAKEKGRLDELKELSRYEPTEPERT